MLNFNYEQELVDLRRIQLRCPARVIKNLVGGYVIMNINESMVSNGEVRFSRDLILDYGTHILYTYSDEVKYLENVISFISTGLELGHIIVLMESISIRDFIYLRLKNLDYHEDQLEKIIFIDTKQLYDTDQFEPNVTFRRLRSKLGHLINISTPVRTWSNVIWTNGESLLKNVDKYEALADEIIRQERTLSVCAYNGNILPAVTQISLMKTHKYIMTDNELFPSSIYQNSSNTAIANIEDNIQESIIQLTKLTRDVKRSEDLEVASLMAQSVSHEVRNPMTTVRGFLQMMQHKVKYKEDERYFHLMINELDRANRIISEFISMSKEKAVKLRRQDLNRVITSIKPLLTKMARESDKSIVINLTKLPKIPLSREEIYRLIFNLVENALESMDSGGVVTIETYEKYGEAVLSIKDCGKGIPFEVLEKMGTPFLTTKKNGKGLGLATSYAILERHKARIEVDTGPSGTQLSIYLKSNTEKNK